MLRKQFLTATAARVADLADDAAPEGQHAGGEDDALDHRHPLRPARHCCMAMMMKAPTTARMVPRPPTSVISTISPDIDQCTSVSETFCATNTFSDPAKPESVPERMKTSSLYWSVL